MNKQQLTCEQNNRNYTIPGGAIHQRRTKNAVHISIQNTLRHELAKTIGAYMLRKYGDLKFSQGLCNLSGLIEMEVNSLMAGFVENKTDFITEAVPLANNKRRVDLVNLKNNQWYEFETDHTINKEDACTIYI